MNRFFAGTPAAAPISTGLNYLASVDQLLVQQKVELLEVFTGFETKNKFLIKNTLGQDVCNSEIRLNRKCALVETFMFKLTQVFWAAEESDCCTRNCCGNMRPFGMKIFDASKTEVLHFHRPLACMGCCFPCCMQSMEVSAPPGYVIGSVEQVWTFCYPHFVVKNSNGETVLRIEGPLCQSSCGGDVNFKVILLFKVSQFDFFCIKFWIRFDVLNVVFEVDVFF